MFEIIYQQKGGKPESYVCTKNRCTVGRGRKNHVVLDSRSIAKMHALLQIDDSKLTIQDLGSMSGTWVNRERIVSYGPLRHSDEIIIGDYRLRVRGKAKPNGAESGSSHTQSQPAVVAGEPASTATEVEGPPGHEAYHWRQFVHTKLLELMDLRRKDVHRMSDEELRLETRALIREILGNHDAEIPPHLDRETLLTDVLNEAVGLGPLEKLLDDESITEIMVNNADEVYIEREGRLEKTSFTFTSPRAVVGVIERIISPLGRRIDESSPMVDARLKDGSRVNAIIPPLAIRGPSLTIRKFSKKRLGVQNLLEFNSLSSPMLEFLRVCVQHRRNIVISGGTGSGKTTLLNVLSNLIPNEERIVTMEDAAELQLNQPNLVSLEARPPNLEGRGQISIRDLVRNALRMRPDRIVVGECRGGEALDMLQAMNTGHDGSLTTAHANSPRDSISRLEVMVLMAGMELPMMAIREQIGSAVNIIVQQTRFPDGTRKVTHITEVLGCHDGQIALQDIFHFQQRGIDSDGKVVGQFVACGRVPQFYRQLTSIGVEVDLKIFTKPEVTA